MKIFKKVSAILLVIALVIGFNTPKTAHAAVAPNLGTASTFSILAQTGITGTGTISGDVGNNGTGAAITALTAGMVGGTIYSTDGVAPGTSILPPSVQADAAAEFNTGIPGQASDGPIVGALDGQTFTPGVYDQGAILLGGGSVTLDGAGIYIFRSASDLTSSGSINFINGARPCDLYWRIQTLATINGTSFAGTILAGTGVHFGAGVVFDGRALAVGGDVTLSSGGSISGPSCPVPPPPPAGGAVIYTTQITPLIEVIKIPRPSNLPSGPGPVTYTYTVTNIGEVPIDNVTVNDDKCSAVSFVDGDDNNDQILDLDESWDYKCTKTVSETETNTVTACGDARNASSSSTICDTANTIVTVGIPVIPPLIHLEKKPSTFLLPAGGGAVTYFYTVTNPGTEPLSDVSVIDDKCTGLPGRVVGHPGDLNKNNLLESNESWSFTCLSSLTQTTTNIATAQGNANGLTVIDYAQAVVAVAAPSLPSTGLAPQNIAWAVGIIVSALAIFYLARRKNKDQPKY